MQSGRGLKSQSPRTHSCLVTNSSLESLAVLVSLRGLAKDFSCKVLFYMNLPAKISVNRYHAFTKSADHHSESSGLGNGAAAGTDCMQDFPTPAQGCATSK